jgi:hypothetical protein
MQTLVETSTKKSNFSIPSAMYPPDWQEIFQFLPRKDNPRKEKEPMSKMADMKQTIEELHNAAAAINDAADWLYQQFSGTDDSNKQQISETAATKEEPKPELKLEDVRSVLAGKSRAGHTADVRDLLQKYGATKLSAIDPANYEALMKDAEAIENGK